MAEIKNLQKVGDRILEAIDQEERIILYSDSDLDGVTALLVLKEAIQSLGGKIEKIYFPNRETEGHGINETALNNLKEKAPALLIVTDMGMGDDKEVKMAQKMGFEIIIIDHHKVLNGVPPASIVVDPKQKGDNYPFKELAASGLVFKLVEVLFNNEIPKSLKKSFLEVTALATVADMMEQKEDNKKIIDKGLPLVKKSWRPGVKALWESDFLDDDMTFNNKISKMLSILNVRSKKDTLPASYRLFTAESEEEAKPIIKEIIQKQKQKEREKEEIIEELKGRPSLVSKSSTIIFEGDPEWDIVLLGGIDSHLTRKYNKPVFLYKKGEKESLGTVRVPKGVDSVDAMSSCSELLETFGGHPAASGFRIKNENLTKFKQRLIDFFKSN
ncbi:MAG: DHH family phosphoesterase [Minisyncoccales bacterium]